MSELYSNDPEHREIMRMYLDRHFEEGGCSGGWEDLDKRIAIGEKYKKLESLIRSKYMKPTMSIDSVNGHQRA